MSFSSSPFKFGAQFRICGIVGVWCAATSILMFLACTKVGAAPSVISQQEVFNLRDLQSDLAVRGRMVSSFQLEVAVCAISRSRKTAILQDATASVVADVPKLDESIEVGDRIRIDGRNCTLNRSRYGIQFGTGAVVEVDYLHARVTRFGSVYMEAGTQPIRIEWFNGQAEGVLELEYEGEEVMRQAVPTELFSHENEDSGAELPGLFFHSYQGDDWKSLPDFNEIDPKTTGVSADLDIRLAPYGDNSGLVFEGLLAISTPGVYKFYLTSDDGSQVFVGHPNVEISSTSGDEAQIQLRTAEWNPSGLVENGEWVSAEGRVVFATQMEGNLELDVEGEGATYHVTILDGSGIDQVALYDRRIRVEGVGRREGVITLDRRYLTLLQTSSQTDEILTRAQQVRRLQPEEARMPRRARLRGVITSISGQSFVIQDHTGGVFVIFSVEDSISQPRLGEMWEVEGTTDPGDFSPILMATQVRYLGSSPMPDAVVPNREQLASGSLDAELVEIEGVVTAVRDDDLVLLTQNGSLRIISEHFLPGPMRVLGPAERAQLQGSVVRVRGVFTASWDTATGRVKPGVCRLGNATMVISKSSPEKPFDLPLSKASDLLLFTSHSDTFDRVKVSGVLLHARPPVYYFSDEHEGFRVVTRESIQMEPGDSAEISGFPRLGGPSPTILEAKVRRAGRGGLPDPISVSIYQIPDVALDSSRVALEANLLSDTLQEDERVIEMQVGDQRFVSRLADPGSDPRTLERGSRVRLTGTYASASVDHPTAGDPFELLLNSPADLVVVERGPWWTLRHTFAAIAVLSCGLLMALFWAVMLRRTVAVRTLELAREIEERQTVERHRAMEAERSRVAHDLHDELGSGITEAGMLASLVKNPGVPLEKKTEYLDQLSEACSAMVTGLDEIVWAVNPRYDSVGDLAGYFSLFAQRFLDLAQIHCRLKIDESLPEIALDSKQRHGLFLAFREALTNIVRHGNAREVTLDIHVMNDTLTVALADNGSGFDVESVAPDSNGLRGMSDRMANLGGKCEVLSNPNGGTVVELTLPFQKNPS